jgi:hypothetical protein
MGKMLDSKDNNFGYNALTGEYEDWSRPACSIRPR